MNNRELFKKIYIEISNVCNLNCPFCLNSKRDKKSLTIEEFKTIIGKIKPYTKYLYFHVLGEPLLHKDINEFIEIASKDFYVNITSNGYLINNLNKANIRQINLSLHSYSNRYKKPLNEYLNDLYNYADNNKEHTYINYRLWTNTDYLLDIISSLENKYHKSIKVGEDIKLDDNVFLSFDKEFIWPSDNNLEKEYSGYCHALTDHIAILSDGTIVPCCLDGTGCINLGNIFSDSLEDVINSHKFVTMKSELQNNVRTNSLCKKCNFFERN